MKFIDQEHKQFYEHAKEKFAARWDVYYDSFFYVIGVNSDTRNHIKDLFNFEDPGIKIEGLHTGFQTSASAKVTRLAFNLWNGTVYDSPEDSEQGKVSVYYAVDNIFCCGYAPYFWEGIKLRYPEFFKSN